MLIKSLCFNAKDRLLVLSASAITCILKSLFDSDAFECGVNIYRFEDDDTTKFSKIDKVLFEG